MASMFRKNTVFFSLLAFIFLVLIYGIVADSENAAFFINGILANIVDPLVWLIALPFALKIHRDVILFPSLLVGAVLIVVFKLYMSWNLSGSIVGEVTGFITVGYLFKTIVVFRGNRLSRSQNTEPQIKSSHTDANDKEHSEKTKDINGVVEMTNLFMDAAMLLLPDNMSEVQIKKMMGFNLGVVDYLSQSANLGQEETVKAATIYFQKHQQMPVNEESILNLGAQIGEDSEGARCWSEGGNAIKAWVKDGDKNAPLILSKLINET